MRNALTIKNITVDDEGRVDFDIEEVDELDGPFEEHFHTNKEAEGLWTGYDYEKQIVGTCDFNLKQITNGGKYKAIKKYFEEDED